MCLFFVVILKNLRAQCGNYGKCPKILNTKVSNKMALANSADQDQTAPEV